jgi:SAM-dependent methyltransferase
MNKSKLYSPDFYEDRSEALESAKVIVPLVLELIKPESVIDVGCGTAEFLNVFMNYGRIEDIKGIDGAWVDKNKLLMDGKKFIVKNLEEPIVMDRRFDLAVSLEVAEHLEEKYAKTFINSLTDLSDIILFSAAIPKQGGIGHVNEQLPDYWAKLFLEHDYVVIDVIREQIWNNKDIGTYYIQNILMFVKRSALDKHKKLKQAYKQTNPNFINIIHPKFYMGLATRQERIKQMIPRMFRPIIKFLIKNKI